MAQIPTYGFEEKDFEKYAADRKKIDRLNYLLTDLTANINRENIIANTSDSLSVINETLKFLEEEFKKCDLDIKNFEAELEVRREKEHGPVSFR